MMADNGVETTVESELTSNVVIAVEDKAETASVETAVTVDSDLTGIIDCRMVTFADPLVSGTWVVPRTPEESKKEMFYTPKDVAR